MENVRQTHKGTNKHTHMCVYRAVVLVQKNFWWKEDGWQPLVCSWVRDTPEYNDFCCFLDLIHLHLVKYKGVV